MIRYSASRLGEGISTRQGLELLATQEEIAPGTEDAMSWMVSDSPSAVEGWLARAEEIRDAALRAPRVMPIDRETSGP